MTREYLGAFDEFVDKSKPNAESSANSPGEGKERLISVTLEDFVTARLPVREKVLAPIIPAKGLVMLYAARGVGKTHIALGISYAVATGGYFLRWHAPKPRRVLFIDGEMPGPALQERANALFAGSSSRPPAKDFYRLLSMDVQALGSSLNLALPEDQHRIEDEIRDTEFLILDNLSTLVNGGRENDADSWDSMQAWLLQLRRTNVTTLLVHHAGRSDNARGTSKREDVLDTVIHLKRPNDYEVEQGARFEVHLTKARGIFGDDALPFEARLTMREGRDSWDTRVLRDRELDRVEDMTREGISVRDIAEELSISKSKVNRMQVKLRADGRLA